MRAIRSKSPTRYDEQGADEITFLDITASSDERDLILHIVEAVAAQVFIPLTVGGGVRSVEDVRRLLNAGADKVSINTAAVQNPQLVADASDRYGAQCIVVAMDAKRVPDARRRAGKCSRTAAARATGLDAIEWGRKMEAARRGRDPADQHGPRRNAAGLRSRAHACIRDALGIPVIASGGVGNLAHLATASQRPCGCGAGGEHLPLRRIHRAAKRRNTCAPAVSKCACKHAYPRCTVSCGLCYPSRVRFFTPLSASWTGCTK